MKALAELRAGIGNLFIDDRPGLSRPRVVKMSKTPCPVNYYASPLK